MARECFCPKNKFYRLLIVSALLLEGIEITEDDEGIKLQNQLWSFSFPNIQENVVEFHTKDFHYNEQDLMDENFDEFKFEYKIDGEKKSFNVMFYKQGNVKMVDFWGSDFNFMYPCPINPYEPVKS